MVKKTAALILVVGGLGACVTVTPPPPALYIENPTASFTASLPLDERIAVEDAWKFLTQGRPDKAQQVILRLGDSNPFYWAGLGYVAFLQEDLTSAEGYFRKAALDHPGLAAAHLGLGQLYRKSGRDEEAYNSYLEVLKRDPENAFARREADNIGALLTDTYLREAKAAADAGDAEKAKAAYLRLLDFSPKLEEAHLALARIYAKEKDIKDALFHLQIANANDPKSKTVLEAYAETLVLANQLGRALDAYERVLALEPGNKAVRDRVDGLKVKLGVIDLPSQYDGIAGMEAAAKEDVAALIAVKFREVVEADPPKPPVIVDISTSWASRFIVKVAALGILDVYSNHTFQPKKPITRGEMAEALVHLIDVLKKKGVTVVAQIPPERIRIADVPPEHLYFDPIVKSISYQVMDLGPDRTFRPEQTMSGPEVIRILDLLAGIIR